MKRLLLIGGIIIILILGGVLLFLLLANPEQKQQVFSAFNFGDTTDPNAPIETIIDTLTGEETKSLAPLRQLSLKRIVGSLEIDPTASSTTPVVLYAEAGTGHIFALDPNSGAENRLSNITIPTADDAVFSRNGHIAAISGSESNDGKPLTLVVLPHDDVQLSSGLLSEKVEDFTVTNNGMLLYTSVVSDGLVGRSYDVDTKVTKTLFTLPFKEATVRFNQSNSGSIYVYPKTAETLEGYLYEVSGGVLQRLPIAGYALNALTHNDSILYSAIKNNLLLSSLYNISTKESLYLPFIFIAEKCTFISGGNNIFCGVHQSLDKHSLFTWYQGALTTSDELWLVNTIDGAVTFLADPVELSGRSVDVTKASGSSDSARLYFINKTDQTLWLFDRSLSTVQ